MIKRINIMMILMVLMIFFTRLTSEPKNVKSSNSSYRRSPWRILPKVISLMVVSVGGRQYG